MTATAALAAMPPISPIVANAANAAIALMPDKVQFSPGRQASDLVPSVRGFTFRRLAQLVRALPSHGRGQRFEPASAYHSSRV
jgi:hypothetical protein